MPSLPVVTSPPLTLAGWLRYELVRSVLAQLEGVRSVLEIGAGEGAFAVRAAVAYDYTALEPDELAFAVARRRLDSVGAGRVLNGGVELLDADARFDLVCAFEVLEHQDDPIRELSRWRERIADGGWMLLSVPAGTRLRSSDLRVGHRRRYSRDRLASDLRDAGLEPVRMQYFGFPLGYLLELTRDLVAVSSRSATAQGTSMSGRWLQPAEQLGWATRAVTSPFRAAQRHLSAVPFGTSILALARPDVSGRAHPHVDI